MTVSDMLDLFVDTSGFGHLVDTTQSYHSLTATIYKTARRQGRKFITTEHIIIELVALLTSPLRIPRAAMIAFIEGIKKSPYVEIVHMDLALNEKAWQLLKVHQDKEWSLVDCGSFVVMKERGIIEALTSDHHFEQAGFIQLLKS